MVAVVSSFAQSQQVSLIGKWQLISTSGGITWKGFEINKNTIVEFTSEFKYMSFKQDSLEYSNTYYLSKSAPEYGRRDSIGILVLGSNSFNKYKFSLQKNRLILREPYPDGFTRIYAREPMETLHE